MKSITNFTCKSALALTLLTSAAITLVWAGSSSELLEKAIYTEESKGDLKAAIELYGQVIKEAEKDNKTAAEALYRQGVCYKLLGNNQKTTEILTQLIKSYPQEMTTVKQAKSLLNQINITKLDLLPEPWKDGEVSYYSLYLPSGTQVGSITSSSRKSINSDQEAWNFETYIIGGNQLYIQSLVNQENFMPISISTKSPQMGHSNTIFKSNKLETNYIKNGQESKKSMQLDKPVYDLYQLGHLLRRLRLSDNYSISMSFYEPLSNHLHDVAITVKGKEKVALNERNFDCFKVKTEVSVNSIIAQETTYWITDDQQRHLVKSDTNGVIGKIERIITDENKESATHRYEDLHFQFKTSLNRQAIDMTFRDDSTALFLTMFKPDMNTDSLIRFLAITPETDNDSAEMRIPENKKQRHIGWLKYENNEVKLRTNLPKLNIAGLSSAMFIADYKDTNDKAMVESRVYFSNQGNLFYFAITTEKSKFPELFEELKNMIDTFEVI